MRLPSAATASHLAPAPRSSRTGTSVVLLLQAQQGLASFVPREADDAGAEFFSVARRGGRRRLVELFPDPLHLHAWHLPAAREEEEEEEETELLMERWRRSSG